MPRKLGENTARVGIMTDIPGICPAEPAVSAGESRELGFSGSRVSDILVRLAIAAWFLVQGANFFRVIAGTLSGPGLLGLDALGVAQIGAKMCIFFFFTM